MAFITKCTLKGEQIEIIELRGCHYAKIKHQPFDKYIIVCRIHFTEVDENTIEDIRIIETTGDPENIISEFDYLDINGENKLNNPLKENLCRSVYYSRFQSKSVPYYQDIGFEFKIICQKSSSSIFLIFFSSNLISL